MKKTLSLCSVFLFFALAVHAQSAEKLSELIQTQNATYGQVAYLAATYQNKVADTADYQQAFDALQKEGAIAADKKAGDVISLAETAKLFANATGLKGGLFYTLTHNARYACKELKAKGFLPQNADPSTPLSGRDVVAVLNGCTTLAGGNE